MLSRDDGVGGMATYPPEYGVKQGNEAAEEERCHLKHETSEE